MEKEKIAFFARGLGLGGIGRACINYVNCIDKNKYDITLFLEKMEGQYLNEIDSNVKVIDFNLSSNPNVLLRKILNFYKLLKFGIKYYHKFYFAANFATTVKSGAILSKYFSLNNAFWFHGNYWENNSDANKFIKRFRIKKYKKIVFVSNYSKDLYKKVYDNTNQKLYVINNPINYQDIISKSKVKINVKSNKTILLNVGRHEEYSKRLSMLLKAVKRLIDDKYDFELWLVGEGPDTYKYKEMVKNMNIGNYVKFLGFSSNVYPYIKRCDAIVLSSYVEGNPVVYLEAKVLNKPIISTDVADAKIELNGFGIVTKMDDESFYLGLKEFLDNGFKITGEFNKEKYNKEVLDKLYKVIED